MTTRHAYDRQALTYDETRAASPSVLGPVVEALAGAPGRELLDVGGGTGNYAVALRELGWEPTVADVDAGMLARAAAKGLATVQADASALPFADRTFDAVSMISMLHHVVEWRDALAEAKRVLRPGGRLAVQLWAREHIEEVGYVHEYVPATRPWMVEQHFPLAELLAELPGARALPVYFTDTQDGSLGALQRRPELLLDPEVVRQTSWYERAHDHHPAETDAGLERLRQDLASGRRPERDPARAATRKRIGDACVLAWGR